MASTIYDALPAADPVENICTIDLYSRAITIPAAISVLGVESDEDVFRLWFSIPKMFGEYDLSTFDIRINYLNANNEGDIYEVTDAAAEDDTLTFSWLIGRSACAYKGNVKFIACFKIANTDGTVLQEFNTAVATLPVLDGIEPGSQIVDQYPDIIEEILQRLGALETSGASGSGGVTSVNGETGAVTITAESLGAASAADLTGINNRMLDTISGVDVDENTGSMELWSRDLNNITTSGFYNAITCTNAKYNYGVLIVIGYYMSGYCVQIEFDVTNAGKYAIRNQVNGVWSAWAEQ